MYLRFQQAASTYPIRYTSTDLPAYPEYTGKSDIHAYFTGQWAHNEPFPCSVPLYQTMRELELKATEARYVQPLFICPGLRAAGEIFYKLQSVTCNLTFEYTKKLGPVTFASRNFTTKMTLRNIWDRVEDGNEHVTIPDSERRTKWTKEDPFSAKMNPYYITEGKIEDQPSPGVGPPLGTLVKSREWALGDYYSNDSYSSGKENLGTIRILGVVKIKDTQQYAVIGISALTPWILDGSGDYVGRGPGNVYLGLVMRDIINYSGAATGITLINGATSKIFTHNSADRVWSQKENKYVDIHTRYSSPRITAEFASGRYSPFL